LRKNKDIPNKLGRPETPNKLGRPETPNKLGRPETPNKLGHPVEERVKLPLFAEQEEAVRLFKKLGKEYAVIKNPSYVYPDYEFYPLPPKIRTPREKLVAIVKDMDGTTTTTEQLCLHSQEFMVGKITGMGRDPGWGLDKKKDYPHIIGNSTTRHVEYLINTYGSGIKPDDFRRSYMNAVLWFLIEGRDERRMSEVINNMKNLGWGGLPQDPAVKGLQKEKGKFVPYQASETVEQLLKKYGGIFNPQSLAEKVRAATEIYYQRYHEILAAIDRGEGEHLSEELLSEKGRRLIEPMPGVAVFLSMIKGWLGEDAALFYDELKGHLLANHRVKYGEKELEKYRPRLKKLGGYFSKNPLRVAVVTSSISYEANIVLREVFNVVRKQIEEWPVTDEKKKKLIKRFQDFKIYYDGYITASDSSEIRLKPHRDLYSIALHMMGVKREDFDFVAGFEDSESGTVAIRAAGMGLCVAVPFSDTAGHNLDAAAYILHGGLPEAILVHNMFLDEKATK